MLRTEFPNIVEYTMLVHNEEAMEQLVKGRRILLSSKNQPVGPGWFIISEVLDIAGRRVQARGLHDISFTIELGYDDNVSAWRTLFPDPLQESMCFSTQVPPIEMEVESIGSDVD